MSPENGIATRIKKKNEYRKPMPMTGPNCGMGGFRILFILTLKLKTNLMVI